MKWISVIDIDLLPAPDEKVLIFNEEYIFVGFLQRIEKKGESRILGWIANPGFDHADYTANKEPTHWMPLPELPKE